MWIKLSGENIISHTYDNISNGKGFDVHIDDFVIVDLMTGFYKYKYVGGFLVEMTQSEIDAHPITVTIRYSLKIKELLEKENKKDLKSKYIEIKKAPSLSQEEKDYIQVLNDSLGV
jgi:hypothetical protein